VKWGRGASSTLQCLLRHSWQSVANSNAYHTEKGFMLSVNCDARFILTLMES
jgi:hypothetical protein